METSNQTLYKIICEINEKINSFSNKEAETESDFTLWILNKLEFMETSRKLEKKYDPTLMNYTLSMLPQYMSDRLRNSIKKDSKRIREEKTSQLEKQKETLLTKISARKHDTLYARLYQWIKTYYVAWYSNELWDTKSQTEESDIIKKIENEVNIYLTTMEVVDDKIHITPQQEKTLITKMEDLLKYATLSSKERKRLQTFCDLLKKKLSLLTAIMCLKNLWVSDSYTKTNEEKSKSLRELQTHLKKVEEAIKRLEGHVAVIDLITRKKPEVDQKKEIAQELVELKEKQEKISISDSVVKANKQWEEEKVKEEIVQIYRALHHKEPAEQDKYSSEYIKIKDKAVINIALRRKELNRQFGNLLRMYLEQELAKYIIQEYGQLSKKEMDYLITDAMMSPEERYIRDMVAAKKMPSGTKVFDLSSKDLKKIRAHSEKYFDDKTDIKIRELKKRMAVINETYFPNIYPLSEIERIVAISEDKVALQQLDVLLKRK